MPLPTQVSERVRQLNPHLFGTQETILGIIRATSAAIKAGPRIRQKTGPKLNKLEEALLLHLRALHPGAEVEPHAVKLRLANGCTYEPDFLVQFTDARRPLIYEAKGPWVDGDAFVKLKVAASKHRWADFWLASRDRRFGAWKMEQVLP